MILLPCGYTNHSIFPSLVESASMYPGTADSVLFSELTMMKTTLLVYFLRAVYFKEV